jgi:hypothetical protein
LGRNSKRGKRNTGLFSGEGAEGVMKGFHGCGVYHFFGHLLHHHLVRLALHVTHLQVGSSKCYAILQPNQSASLMSMAHEVVDYECTLQYPINTPYKIFISLRRYCTETRPNLCKSFFEPCSSQSPVTSYIFPLVLDISKRAGSFTEISPGSQS